MTDSFSTIDSHLPIEEEDIKLPQLESEPPKVTKHSLSTSPWSRLLIIAVPFGAAFFIIFLFINSIFNPSSEPVKTAKKPQETSTVTEKVEQDGDIYAKLALSEQEDDLNKLNSDKSKQEQLPEVETQKTAKIVNQTPPTPRTVQRPGQRATTTRPQVRETTARVSSPLQRSFVASTQPVQRVEAKPIDPTAEFLRLRNIGSYGLIAYADTTSLKTNKSSSSFPDPAQSAPQTTRPRTTVPTAPTTPNNTNTIEKIRPRWQAEVKADKPVANNYLPQESQILQERRTRYLTVGEFASGVMVTPAVKQQTDNRNQQQQTDDGRRFVARLTEDLHDNYGDVAIPSGTLLAVELVSVDGGDYAQAQVTSIIKDNTEYPIKGAIAVQGDKGKPLIAKKYHDKGGDLARQDLTIGLLAGLGKVGEIINRPDTQSSFQSSNLGSSSSATTQNNRRNITGALLEGAFGEMSEIVRDRAERSTQEILSRPNVYYIPQNTKVTFIVNRTLELP